MLSICVQQFQNQWGLKTYQNEYQIVRSRILNMSSCFSTATFKHGMGHKASWKFLKTDSAHCILFPFVWKPVLLKEFKGKQDRDSSSKQTTSSLCVNKVTFPPAPDVQPPTTHCHCIPEPASWLQNRCCWHLILHPRAVSWEAPQGINCRCALTIAWKYCYLDCLQLVVLNEGKERAAAATAELKRSHAHYFLFVQRVAKITYWA